MPRRSELVWSIVNWLAESLEEHHEEEITETVGLVERELCFLEKGLMDPNEPSSRAFLKAILDELNPVVASSWRSLSQPSREQLMAIKMRALRLSLQERLDSQAIDPSSLDELGPTLARIANGG